jgi:hypothetical protein
MKVRHKILTAAALSAVLIMPALGSRDYEALSAKIGKACAVFTRAGAEEGDCKAAFLQLVEVVEATAPKSSLPAAVGAKISEARRLFASASILNPGAVALLKDAYAAVNGGRPFAFPEGLTGLDGITARMRTMSETAQKNLEAGQTDAAFKTVLEILLMIVTPVEAH